MNKCEYEAERNIVGGGCVLLATAISSVYQVLLRSSFGGFYGTSVFNIDPESHCFL